jgi:inward rectifier potassium channel
MRAPAGQPAGARICFYIAALCGRDLPMTRRLQREKAARYQMGSYAFTTKGISRFDIRDPYHIAVSLTWPQFLATLLGLYLTVNLLFATLYTLVPGSVVAARRGNFFDAFFFSFETLATVGYGEMYPGNFYGHLVACAEIACGVAFTAIITGLTFVRFSRPKAKFIVADSPVVSRYNGQPTLMLRVGNGRPGLMADVTAQLNVLLSETTLEGTVFRRSHSLTLIRNHLPILPLAWTIMHLIDESSPLYGFDSARLVKTDARLFLSIKARDPSLSAEVYDMRGFRPEDISFGMRYVDAVSVADDGATVLEMDLISTIEPDGPSHPGRGGLV